MAGRTPRAGRGAGPSTSAAVPARPRIRRSAGTLLLPGAVRRRCPIATWAREPRSPARHRVRERSRGRISTRPTGATVALGGGLFGSKGVTKKLAQNGLSLERDYDRKVRPDKQADLIRTYCKYLISRLSSLEPRRHDGIRTSASSRLRLLCRSRCRRRRVDVWSPRELSRLTTSLLLSHLSSHRGLLPL